MSLTAFEDFQPGETRAYGAYQFSAPDMAAFASTFDPQAFHLDEAAGRDTILGGLAASGWHTCSALMRMMVDGWLAETSCLAGVGVEDNRWLAPVRPGDILSARTQTLAKIDLRSRPDAGIVKFATSLCNQAGVEVMTQNAAMLFGRRRPLGPDFAAAPAKEPRRPDLSPERIDDCAGVLPDHFARARIGAYAELGETHFTPDVIRAYAEKFDPLPFHLDEEAGRKHVLGAMSAAGWHTASCWMRHFVAFRAKAAGGAIPSRASPGFSDLVWRKPVLVGDRISFSTQVVGKRPTSKPGLGLIRSRNRGVNQRGETVLDFYASGFSPMDGE